MILKRLLLFSHSGFSDTDANGITMKNLLSAWAPEYKAEFYCDVQPPDYSAAHNYFRVTDVQAVKAFLGKKSRHIYTYSPDENQSTVNGSSAPSKNAKKIPLWLKKRKYNFCFKWIREYLRQISPWGHGKLKQWVRDFAPDVLFYMVGESIFMDKLVLKVCRETGKPLVLYNGEAYRIIDLKKRKGMEKAYYRKVEKLYEELNSKASLVIYNCEMLKEDYEAIYPSKAKAIVAYNSAECDIEPYKEKDGLNITYFGNLGVGRSPVLLQVADVLNSIDPALKIDIYGNAMPEFEEKFRAHSCINYHGFVDSEQLKVIIGQSDILLHVESFENDIIPKLKYAFSTKIAQCLCAGRCFVSYAPAETASSRYLANSGGAVMVSTEEELEKELRKLINDPEYRKQCSERAIRVGLANHSVQTTARFVREKIEAIL